MNSIKINNGIVQIEYLDNSRTETGRNEAENLFTLDLNQGTLIDNTNTSMGNDLYQVTEVRRSNPISRSSGSAASFLRDIILDSLDIGTDE